MKSSWRNDKIATERLTKEEARIEALYKTEQKKIEILYQKQKESDNYASGYLENKFKPTYELGSSFLSLLENYFPLEKKEPNKAKPAITTGNYFDKNFAKTLVKKNAKFRP